MVHHSLPLSLVSGLRERAHFRPVSATRRPRHFRWLLIGREDDHVTSILASDWLIMVVGQMGVERYTPHGDDDVIVDVIGDENTL